MTGSLDDAGAPPGALHREEDEAHNSTCVGCGRTIHFPPEFPGGRFLCMQCHHVMVDGNGERRGVSGRWFRSGFLVGLTAVAAAGISLCSLYLLGTGRGAWFTTLIITFSLTLTVPLWVYRKRRNLYLVISALYLPLGLWCFLWYLAPGVGWDYPSSLLGGGFFFLVLGAGGVYLYYRDLRSLPRW